MIVAVKSKTVQRAEVIAKRTGNIAEGFLKSQMIDLLKEKMKNGVAHFVFKKKRRRSKRSMGYYLPQLNESKHKRKWFVR